MKFFIICVFVIFVVGLPTSSGDCGRTPDDIIRSGTCMTNDNGNGMDVRMSCDGCFKLIFQNDGNLVVYASVNNAVIWHANSHNKGGVKACMQTDGRFVIYTANDVPIWFSQWFIPNGNTGAVAIIQGDANFVVYTGHNTPSAQAKWSSGKMANCDGSPKRKPSRSVNIPNIPIFSWSF